jgi:hypothetical protein
MALFMAVGSRSKELLGVSLGEELAMIQFHY